MEKKKEIDDRQFAFRKQKSTIDAISKIVYRLRRKEKTAAIFFNIEKTYDKFNREKTFEQLENMKIQGRMKEFLRELISERWIKVRMGVSISQSKQTDMGIPQGGVLSVTIFLVANNGILEELGNGVDELLFADDLAI